MSKLRILAATLAAHLYSAYFFGSQIYGFDGFSISADIDKKIEVSLITILLCIVVMHFDKSRKLDHIDRILQFAQFTLAFTSGAFGFPGFSGLLISAILLATAVYICLIRCRRMKAQGHRVQRIP